MAAVAKVSAGHGRATSGFLGVLDFCLQPRERHRGCQRGHGHAQRSAVLRALGTGAASFISLYSLAFDSVVDAEFAAARVAFGISMGCEAHDSSKARSARVEEFVLAAFPSPTQKRRDGDRVEVPADAEMHPAPPAPPQQRECQMRRWQRRRQKKWRQTAGSVAGAQRPRCRR